MRYDLTPREIAQRLASQVDAVCAWLLPGGKRDGSEYRAAGLQGGDGKSLGVRLTGDKAGVWKDFAGAEKGGDLLDLIAAVKGVGKVDAIREAKAFLRIDDPLPAGPRKEWKKPKPRQQTQKPGLDRWREYLTNERKCPASAFLAFGVGGDSQALVFESLAPNGELIARKTIGIDRGPDGKKRIHNEPGCAPSLFGWQAMPDDADAVVISEGQIDAITWHAMGFPALSVPNGVGDPGWIEYEWENLARFERIYLSFDADEPGQKAVKDVARRLGLHRCWIVPAVAGKKDANDALVSGATSADFSKAIADAKCWTPPEIRRPTDFADAVIATLFDPNGSKAGFWPETLHGKIGFRDGELSIWTGISGHGKSNLLLQVSMEAAAYGHRVAIASMEMPGHKTLIQAVKMASPFGPDKLTPELTHHILGLLVGKLWIFDLLGAVQLSRLLDLMEYAARRYAVTHFVIDSLMKLDVSSEDYEAQRVALNSLVSFARQNQAHVHLVCHARKQADEAKNPGKMDVKGSGDIINQGDNILSVWRNKAKEEKARGATLSDREKMTVPDTLVYVEKDRENGEEQSIPLLFHKGRRRFVPMEPDFSIPKLLPDDDLSETQ